jgi:hypothetical protein
VIWPENHKTVELGIITLISVDPDSAKSEKALAFDTRFQQRIGAPFAKLLVLLSSQPIAACNPHVIDTK